MEYYVVADDDEEDADYVMMLFLRILRMMIRC